MALFESRRTGRTSRANVPTSTLTDKAMAAVERRPKSPRLETY